MASLRLTGLLLLVWVSCAASLQLLPPPIHETVSRPSTGRDGATADATEPWPRSIYVTHSLAETKDKHGLTLIPPSGYDFARVFAEDLSSVTTKPWSLHVLPPNATRPDSGIVLDLHSCKSRAALNLTYENGNPTEEGYSLVVAGNLTIIKGTGARGAWWGTRTLLQHILRASSSPLARSTDEIDINIVDAPAFATRGYMLDAGRKWYSPAFLKELCSYASFFKMSEFHYHTSDNYPLNRGQNKTWQDVYSQFSLRPEQDLELLQGLVERQNETLSRADFEDLQLHCVRRGITVIPEIEAPGHCLSITKWKPELALPNKKDLLNLTHPESITTVKRIWQEFLPWFQTKEVHIGADEYDSDLSDDYIDFVNEMEQFVQTTSGKNVRIWGTYEPSENLTISNQIVVQHWQYGQSDPVALTQQGHQVINSEDWWAYMSLKNDHMPILPAPYPQFFNESRVFDFAGFDEWQWEPSLYNPVNTTEQLPITSVKNKGAILAAWNDNGPYATTQLEAYYAMRRGIPLVASRAWAGERGPVLEAEQWTASVERYIRDAPSQNLDRNIRNSVPNVGGINNILSWNRRNASTSADSPVTLGYGSKGPNYTMTLSVTGPFNLSSSDATLSLSQEGCLVFVADGTSYPLRSVDPNDGFEAGHPGRIWSNVTTSTHEVVRLPDVSNRMEVTLTGDYTGGSRVWVDGRFKGRFEVFVYGGRNTLFSWSQLAFVAPLDSMEGGIERIHVRDDICPPSPLALVFP